jgi:hypothetical protein
LSEGDHVDASTSPATVEADVAGVQDKPSGARRLVNILGVMLVVVLLPGLAAAWVAGAAGVAAIFVGLTLGIVGSKLSGFRRMVYVVPVIGVAAGLAASAAFDWWWVAVVAVAGVIAGAGIASGFPGLLMVPFAATFVSPAPSARDAAVFGVIVTIGTLYGIIVARRFGAPPSLESKHAPVRMAAGLAIVLAIVLGASAAVGVALGWSEPYWVPDPILVLLLYILIGKRDRVRGKAIGTAIGAAAAIVVAVIGLPNGALSVLAALALLLALTQYRSRYWLMYGLYTFALVLVLAAPGQVAFEAEERGLQVLVGIGLLVIGVIVFHALATWLSKRDPQPELAPTA